MKGWLSQIKANFYKTLDESLDDTLDNEGEEEQDMTYRPTYLEMVSYKRPQGSKSQNKFCRRFIRPIFGVPDVHGNYTKIINDGDKLPHVAFMAHHDTVHREGGRQTPIAEAEFVKIAADCLGADCTTGVYIILRMIEANIPGVYVIHAAEEIGCVGSRALVKDTPEWFTHVKAAISFDRKGYYSIITHQLGRRTCSDAFAHSLAGILGGDFETDPTGAYTDSNEYVDYIPECTNLSVGYFNQHTSKEFQDVAFMEALITDLIAADWSKLVIERKAGSYELDEKSWAAKVYGKGFSSKFDDWEDEYYAKKSGNVTQYGSWGDDSYAEEHGGHPSQKPFTFGNLDDDEDDTQALIMKDVIFKYAEEVAEILISYGYNASGLLDDAEDIAVKRNRPIGRMIGGYR